VRKALLIIAGFASAAAAAEFPYYPEYAEEFAKVEEVTPLMAKKVVMVRPFICPVGAVVCEPLVIRDIAGKPIWISINAYAGNDLSLVDRYNGIVRSLNAGERFYASALELDLSYFAGGADFAWVTLGAYTRNAPGFPAASYGALPALSGYRTALAFAREELGNDDLYLNRIVGRGFSSGQAFEFETPTGETVIVDYDPCGGEVSALDAVKAKEVRREIVKSDAAVIERFAASGRLEERLREWAEIDAQIPDDVAADEYARIPPRVPEKNLGQTERAEP
jgi:hypothetical protein